jgi:alanyl-tRNA synthetase
MSVCSQGYEKFKKAADAVKENGGTVLSGQASVLNFGIAIDYLIISLEDVGF